MRKTVLVLAPVAVAMLVVGGVAWAATLKCPNYYPDHVVCHGTNKADTMHGTQRFNAMHGRGGADTMYLYDNSRRGESARGGAGSDKLYGGKGRDTLWGGGYSRDGVVNDQADDYLYGGRGDDYLFGGIALGGVDRIYGERGNDGAQTNRWSGVSAVLTKEIVDCGAGTDEVWFDEGVDVVKANCEIKHPR
jgi:Ca2+-binding RTX toxin-like protein